MDSLIQLAAHECCVQDSWVADAVRQGASRVKLLKIQKSTPGKFRIISRPSAELEILQRWLTIRFFKNMDVHDSAMAFVQGRSILTNAKSMQNHLILFASIFRIFSRRLDMEILIS
jgi:RNA-directed DNA polymerase